jgi:hypothetical protein
VRRRRWRAFACRDVDRIHLRRALFACLAVALVACHSSAKHPRPTAIGSRTVAAIRASTSLHGVASDGTSLFAAFASNTPPSAGATPADSPIATTTIEGSIIEARHGDKIAWQVALAGRAGELAVVGSTLAVALDAKGTIQLGAPLALRGDPAALLAVLDKTSGALRWSLPFDSTQYTLINALAPLGDDVLVAGAFAGTLRVGAQVVSSAGGSDGFVARISAGGKLAWLVRVGGPSADAIQGVAATSSRIAIAGTFSPGTELQGVTLASIDERMPFGDAFVASLDLGGKRRWSASFGSRADDAVAGVAMTGDGLVAVAASVRDTVQVGSSSHITRGASDGLVAFYADDGELSTSVLVGGGDFDGLRSIASLHDHVVIGGFFSGTIKLADREMTAGGGDDSFLAVLDGNGTVATAWHVGGAGREEITAVSAVPGGFVAGVAHTASLAIDTATLPAPADPASGAAIVLRGF